MHPMCPTIWHQGSWAFGQGVPKEECPYPPNTDASAWWLDGWTHSKENGYQKLTTIEIVTYETVKTEQG